MIAYITSGKIGIPRFTYNELKELEKQNIGFILCLTQLKKGPWMPEPHWSLLKGNLIKAVFSIFILILSKPGLFFKLGIIAIHSHVISYYLLSLSFFLDLREQWIDSLHCQMGDKKLYIGFFLKKLLNKPLTTTIHAHELYQRSIYDKPENLKWLFSNCDHIITVSDFNASILFEKFAIPQHKISIMRLFPNTETINLFKDKKKILVVANWAKKKGYEILVEAVSKMNRNDFIIMVVGESYHSPNSVDLRKMIKDKNITEKFQLLGHKGGFDLELIFSSCDIFCLPSITEYFPDGKPSEREGIPVALMEAMAWGKPVISTKHAGIPELVEEILVDEKDINQLVFALEFLLDNPTKREEMGKRNIEIIKKKYYKENIKVIVDLFNSFK